MSNYALILPTLAAVAAAAVPVSMPKSWTARERDGAKDVTANVIAAHVRFLADDLLEGRAPGSRGSELAMKYIASEYERLGLEPAGDHGGYLQRFDMMGLNTELTSPPTFEGKAGSAPLTLRPQTDTVVEAGVEQEAVQLKGAEVVFVGYGITAPEENWDDFKDVDVRGKVLLVMNNDPSEDPHLFAGKTRLYYGRWSYKYEQAARKGAAGAIVIHTTPSAGYPWQVVQTSWSGEKFELPQGSEPRIQVKMWTTEEVSRKIAALGGQDLDELRRRAEGRDFRPMPLGVKLSVALKTKLRKIQTANVLGLLPGGDAKLKPQVVVYSAHHDHLGIGVPKKGDAIYNGAQDNASGVAGILAIAEAMSEVKPSPKRSVLFAAVAAEESGLVGSEYFCAHPKVAPGRIAANINIDGLNIYGRARDVSFIGMGKTSLDKVVLAAAAGQGRVVKPDQFPDRGFFYRSDQFNFARIGVPPVYFHTGTDFVGHEPSWGRERQEEFERTRYHQPSDQIDETWNLEGAQDDVRLLFVIGLRVADAPAMPQWRPGDEFEAARKRALGQVTGGPGTGGP